MASIFVLTICKALAAAAFIYIPSRPGLDFDILSSIVIFSVFCAPYASLAGKRFDALGLNFLGNMGFFVVMGALFLWIILDDKSFCTGLWSYGVQAALLLSLALLPDKPVSASGYVLQDGGYVKPDIVQDVV